MNLTGRMSKNRLPIRQGCRERNPRLVSEAYVIGRRHTKMSPTKSKTEAADLPAALRINALRAGLVLGIAAALLAFVVRTSSAQQNAILVAESARAPVPYVVGEELVYGAKFGIIPAGTARMRVEGIDTVRGRLAYHVIL